jgi:hypothetical protein
MELYEKLKNGKANETITGKGSFSKTVFANFVNAHANDKEAKIPFLGKDGKAAGININELLLADAKKTITNAKYPQKSELGVLDKSELATDGLAEAIPAIVTEWLRTGKKFPLLPQKEFAGTLYLVKVPARTKVVTVRNFQTREKTGTSTITTKDSIQVRAKSPVPAHLVTKVKRDLNGKVID